MSEWTTPRTTWNGDPVFSVDLNRMEKNTAALHSGGGQSVLTEIEVVDSASFHLSIGDVESKFGIFSNGFPTYRHISSIYSAGRLTGCTVWLRNNGMNGIYLVHNGTPYNANYSKIMVPGATSYEVKVFEAICLFFDGTAWYPSVGG